MKIDELRGNAQIWQVLEQRARELAQGERGDESIGGEEILAFRLGEGSYTLPVRFVLEVQPLGSYTALPGTPSFVIGLVNVRGRLLAALDFRPLLDIALTPPPPNAALLIVSAGGVEVGLLADSVLEVRRGDTALATSPAASAGQSAAWVRGVDSHLCLQLDLPALLADPRLVVDVEG
jgi:purine-binding chemotaxis protein CheW